MNGMHGVVADFSNDTWWIWVIKAVGILVFLLLNVLLAIWAERRILGFTDGLGRALAHPRPKMVRGDVADADVDYMYSELALLAW